MTVKIDLTDFFELFRKPEEKPPVEPPVSPEARRLRRVFADNIAAVLSVRADSVEARTVAYENTITTLLAASHLNTDPSRCAHCGRLETPDETLRPIGQGVLHTWLHSDCWEAWSEARRNAAIAELAAAGVMSPCDGAPDNKEKTAL